MSERTDRSQAIGIIVPFVYRMCIGNNHFRGNRESKVAVDFMRRWKYHLEIFKQLIKQPLSAIGGENVY